MFGAFRWRVVVVGLAMACLAVHLAAVHRWFAVPFATWAGWDEAYIAAFAQRMLNGSWLPYVDAVSHRGPMLYWIAAAAQWMAGGYSWAAMRHAALLFAEANLWFAFLLGVSFRRPLAGFVAGATFVFATAYAMEPKDGIGFNGEIVGMPFVLLGAVLATRALRESAPTVSGGSERLWIATLSGLMVSVGGLCKQPAMLHLLPLLVWWLAAAVCHRKGNGNQTLDLRPTLAFVIGAATPVAAVVVYFACAGAWKPFVYYTLTYNRSVYMAPVTVGFAIESVYLFLRSQGALLLMIMVTATWAIARFASKLEGRGVASWAKAYVETAVSSTTVLQMLLGLIGAAGTVRFWDHYFINALPWLGLLFGVLLEERICAMNAFGTVRTVRSTAVVVVGFVCVSFLLRHMTTLWLDGQRRLGDYFGRSEEDPVAAHVRAHSNPDQSVFVWGFAPEIYTNARRRSASRYVFTTFVSGSVPWFPWVTFEQEQQLVVPGSREILLKELAAEKPPLILDVPGSIRGRSIRHYPELLAYLQQHYCYRGTLVGRNERIVDMYHRRNRGELCDRTPPPLFAIP